MRRHGVRIPLVIGRRLAVAAALLACAGGDAQAQRWMAGLKTGVGQGGFTGSQEFDWGRAMPTFSAFALGALDERWSIQPEIAYVRTRGTSSLPTSTLTLTADYLHVPVLLQYNVPLSSTARVAPFVAAGPSLGFKLRCTLAFVGGGIRSSDDCDADRGVQSNSVDFGATGSLGLAGFVGSTRLGLEGRYSAGLRSFVVPLDQENSRSYGWSIVVSASLPLRWRPASRPPETVPTLPPLRLEPTISTPAPETRERTVTTTVTQSVRLISVSAVDVDARTLLLAIAREAGLNVVVASEVRARVSVSLTNVSAAAAIQAVIDVAGLSVIVPMLDEKPAVVFYAPPVDVNTASASTIATRFGVSSELARWVTANQRDGIKVP